MLRPFQVDIWNCLFVEMPLQISVDLMLDSLADIDKEAEHVLSETFDHQHLVAYKAELGLQEDADEDATAVTLTAQDENVPASRPGKRVDSFVPVPGPSNPRKILTESAMIHKTAATRTTKEQGQQKPLLSHRRPQPPSQRPKKEKRPSIKELAALYPTAVAYASYLQTLYTGESSSSDPARIPSPNSLFSGLRILPVYRSGSAEKLYESTRLFLDALHRAGAFIETSLTPQTTHIVAYRPSENSPVWRIERLLRSLGLGSVTDLSAGRGEEVSPPFVVDVAWVYESLEDPVTGQRGTARRKETTFLISLDPKDNTSREAVDKGKVGQPSAVPGEENGVAGSTGDGKTRAADEDNRQT
jgi:hypothetical protein